MFCSIIGHPLKSPRSVKIWKSFFKKKKLEINMLALDLNSLNFESYIKNLSKNENFLASAITMPYKKKVIKYVKINDKISSFANSINLIIRKKNTLLGYNTDVYGALESVKNLNNKKILIFGFGGTGEAIYKTFSKVYKKAKFTIISSNTKLKLMSKTKIKKKITEEDISSTDLFINCTPLGSDLKKKFLKKSPLKINQLLKMKKKSIVFDIIYSPKKTILSKYCKKLKIKYINGIKMNTIQASKALSIIEKEIKRN